MNRTITFVCAILSFWLSKFVQCLEKKEIDIFRFVVKLCLYVEYSISVFWWQTDYNVVSMDRDLNIQILVTYVLLIEFYNTIIQSRKKWARRSKWNEDKQLR